MPRLYVSPMRRLFDQIGARLDRAAGNPRPERHVIRGVRVAVANTRPDIESAYVLARLDAALGLIAQYQPVRLRHLLRDVVQISVTAFPCRGAYLPAQRTILTELSFLARTAEFSAAQIASSIVHESVHARVHRMAERLGLSVAERDMAREERLCRRAELAFGQALPPALGEPVVRRAVESLGLADAEVAPVVDWAAAHAAKRAADADAIQAWRKTSGG
jgi:hypothetical protein